MEILELVGVAVLILGGLWGLLRDQRRYIDAKFAAQDVRFAELDRRLAKLEKQLAEQDRRLTELEKRLAKLEKQLAEQQKQLTKQQKQLAEQGKQLTELEKYLTEISTLLSVVAAIQNEQSSRFTKLENDTGEALDVARNTDSRISAVEGYLRGRAKLHLDAELTSTSH